MFKSCDYCRHRKKRCVVEWAGSRCTDCEHLDLPCEFSQRRPSLKRRQTSRNIAARLGLGGGESKPTDVQPAVSGLAVPDDGVFSDAGRRRVKVDSLTSKINKTLLERRAAGGSDGSTASNEQRRYSEGGGVLRNPLYDRYVHDVQPFLPFVAVEMLADNVFDENGILADCLSRACALSLHLMHAQRSGDASALDDAIARQHDLSLADAAGVLLLMPCMHFSEATIERVLKTVEATSIRIREEEQQQHTSVPRSLGIPACVMAGAVSAYTWKQLVGRPTTLLRLPTDMLHGYAMSLGERTFARHYLLLADIGARFNQQCIRTELDGVSDANDATQTQSTRIAWAKLEYECLLWQVRLPPHLLDLRDELPATPESLVMHQLSSLVLLSLYSYILNRTDTLGGLIALRPVPGVLYFMCALARSVFICPRAVLDRWDLIVDIRATTARIMLQLWHQTHFENCRAILDMWTDVEERHAAFAAQVREEIGTGPWTVDEIDGYSVFWTYRDLRALTLELIVGDPGMR
ncbi:hypothetical protein HMPREF1624_06229 [Sporothrix schenckii ATCC 58251]|uniref:Zn(2)-C6 fungal-type domain-containing protein n=1 Tax=Sporothrix schenckii (strain ATCC 58251 / de Perez 2211183) TaxID=1391915 RepID=U7PMS0_SPOS1|nr:hypothetical protein HMPREF1624_06229 [Sporothrix schenckii ATCC 58251]